MPEDQPGASQERLIVDPFHVLSRVERVTPDGKRHRSQVWTTVTGGASWEQVSVGWRDGQALAQNAARFALSPAGDGCMYRVEVREWKLDKLGKRAGRLEARAIQRSLEEGLRSTIGRVERESE